MRTSLRVVVALAVAVALSAVPVPSVAGESVGGETIEKEFTSEYGIEYVATLDTETHVLTVRAQNPTDNSRESVAYVSVGRATYYQSNIDLRPGEAWTDRIELRPNVDALEETHNVTVSTVGEAVEFSFDLDVDPENPDGVKIPRIRNVDVGTAVVDGEPSAVVNVTVVNPSVQTYPTKLMVHTKGTDGSFYLPSTAPGESETITVELLDERGSHVAGEARLYAGEFNESDGGLDQVGFAGRADGETAQWNESFEPVAAPWSDEPYQYENASVGDGRSIADRASGGHDVGGVPVVYPVLALVGVALLAARLR